MSGVGRGPLAVCIALFVAVATSGCLGVGDGGQAQGPSCPAAWKSGWQKLADRVDAPVYCPSWIPVPLTGEIGGPWNSIRPIDERDGSYLIGFLWQERAEEVHVNLRGYPGRTEIPSCVDTYTVAGVTRRKKIPCFSDSQGRRRIGALDVTVYTVNRGADEWHVLYAWRRNGSLYTVSQHVAPPMTHARVVESLDRMARGLALLEPQSA